ncbi:MAG: hypothetical protein C0447_12685, partial [Methylobacterium sp.]|nr:hypothetical protein [Methylobacterium sp.]
MTRRSFLRLSSAASLAALGLLTALPEPARAQSRPGV